MPWVRFDDQYPIHRKIGGLSDAAFRLHTEAIFWCARNLTDGFVTEEDLALIAPRVRSRVKLTDEYLARNLWHSCTDTCPSEKCPAPVDNDGRPGWVIHDYWEYQPSALQVQREREAKAVRQKRWLEGKRREKDTSRDASQDTSRDAPRDDAPPRTRPVIGAGAVTEPSGRHHRTPVENPSFSRQINPGDGAAARHPSARPLPAALAAAGVNGKPADDGTIARLAAQARQAITQEGTHHD